MIIPLEFVVHIYPGVLRYIVCDYGSFKPLTRIPDMLRTRYICKTTTRMETSKDHTLIMEGNILEYDVRKKEWFKLEFR